MWIEIYIYIIVGRTAKSRPARGVWIEILTYELNPDVETSRAPRGACGLKWKQKNMYIAFGWSRPARGVWIEILWFPRCPWDNSVAPREGRVD